MDAPRHAPELSPNEIFPEEEACKWNLCDYWLNKTRNEIQWYNNNNKRPFELRLEMHSFSSGPVTN